MEKIIGLIDAPFTPFYENGEVNYEPIPAYAQMLAKNGMKVMRFDAAQVKVFYDATAKVREQWTPKIGASLVKAAEADMTAAR